MKIATAWSTAETAGKAVDESFQSIRAHLGDEPHMLMVFASASYDNDELVSHLRPLAPQAQLIGGTSCLGVLTREGFHSVDGRGMGLLAIHDPLGSYGVGIAEINDDVAASTKSAIDGALSLADRPGELPALVLTSSSPGFEEHQINAIEELLGQGIPIFGGTSADNDMSGQWQQFGNDRVLSGGFAAATLFPTCDVGYAFHSGYEPTDKVGMATRVKGRRLYEIDGKPAAKVYDKWSGGLITSILPEGGSMVPTATFSPLGDAASRIGAVDYYRLVYPVAANADGSLELFAQIDEGRKVVLMRGTPDSLTRRASRVVEAAIDGAPFSIDECTGALVYFCTGCMLAIQGRLDETVQSLSETFSEVPFLCTFTLGEQGCFVGGENRHGNLMIAAIVFGPGEE